MTATIMAMAGDQVLPKLLRTAFILTCLFMVLPAEGMAAVYPDGVECLLSAVETSDVKFIRHSSAYEAAEAGAHLRNKMDKAGDRITSAEGFIEHIASRSSMTGEPYFILLKDGKKVESGHWLGDRLKDCRK